MFQVSLQECLEEALAQNWVFAEVSRVGANCCHYSYGAHIERILDKLIWQSTEWGKLDNLEWDFLHVGLIVETHNPDNCLTLYKDAKHSSREI